MFQLVALDGNRTNVVVVHGHVWRPVCNVGAAGVTGTRVAQPMTAP